MHKKVWKRLTATLLAALMLISSDSVVSLGQTSAEIASAETDTSENSNENTSDTKAQDDNSLPASEKTDEEKEKDDASDIKAEKDANTDETPAAFQQEIRSDESVKNSSSDELTVSISATSLTAAYGTEIVLKGSVSDESARLQWQRMDSDGEWKDIDGENTSEYRFVFNEENALCQYRLAAEAGATAEDTVYSNALSITRQFSSLQELIEAYYGSEDGSTPATDPQEAASVNVTRSDGSNTEVLAGDTISLRVEYYFSPAPTYNYGNSPESIYDTYNGSTITITLPEGMSISKDDNVNIPGIEYFDEPENPKEDNTYTFHLSAASLPAESGTTGSFILNVRIDGNGTLPVGSEFDFADDMASVSTSFDIMDKSGSSAEVERKVSQTNTSESAPATLTAVTNDSWVIDKEFQEAGSPYMENGEEKVKVTFSLAVGLDSGNGTASSTSSNYAVHGRAPFAENSVSLTETPAVEDREGTPITADRITIIPDFDKDHPITVSSAGDTVALPMDTCEGRNLAGVAESAPYYSTYTVEIVYPYEKFVAEYYDENQDLLTVENTAVLNYQIAGMDPADDEAYDSGEVGEVTEPAAITISKYIDGSLTESPALYAAGTDWDPVEGAAEFTITDSQGKPAVLYYLDGSTYRKLEADGESLSVVFIDPEGADQPYIGTDGTITVYLDPGTYTVTETDGPDNTVIDAKNKKEVTVGDGETGTAEFTNKEQLGSIEVHKIGIINDSRTDLQDAEFGLYSDSSCGDEFRIGETQTTGSNGSLVFDRLEISDEGKTYYVKELNAPPGYIYEPEVQEVQLSTGDSDKELTFTNTYNGAYISLEKMIYNFSAKKYESVGNSRYSTPADFNSAFTIQRWTKTADGNWKWTDVDGYTSVSLAEDGCYTPATPLPVYDENGDLIQYRVREILPEGLHAGQGMTEAEEVSGDKEISVAYKEFNLESEEGNSASSPYVITLNNDRNGSFTLTKSFYQASASGMVPVTGKTAEFTLYRRIEGGAAEEVGRYEISASSPRITVSDLERVDGDGNACQYYWAESERTDNYQPAAAAGGTRSVGTEEIQVDGGSVTAYGPYNFTEAINGNIELSQTITVSNIEQKVPAVVYKIDTVTEQFVKGTKFTVYRVADGENQPVEGLTDVAVTGGSGAYIELDPGFKYVIAETDMADGYACVNTEDELTIDLTDLTDVTAGTGVYKVTIKNEPDPSLRVVKKLNDADETDETLTGVAFEVYTRNDNGTFTRFHGYDGSDLSVTSGSSVRLPEGTYYLREIAPEDTVLGPEDYYDLYKDAGAVKSSDEADTNVYFGPYTVEKTADGAPITVTITNYASDGAVTVTKQGMKTDGTSAPLSGATLKIYRKDSNGSVIEAGNGGSAYTVETNSRGEATFTGLPVYNPDTKEKYTYYVKETEAPDGYSVNNTEVSFQLEAGTTVTGEALTIVDQPVLDFIVTKQYYNVWESNFTHKNYLLPGTVIALYRLEGNEYVLEDVKTTGDDGTVTFEDLNQADSYVAIEVRVPEGDEYAYLEPGNGDYLDPDYNGDPEELPASIPAQGSNGIGRYNYVQKPANTGTPESEAEDTLINVENWTQLRIRKFKWNEGDEHSDEKKVNVNNAEFTLYQQILPEGTDTNAVLNPTLDEIEQMTVIGTYSSGTYYNAAGERQDGWFATDILNVGDRVVYWLVENYPGIGAEIKPENKITLIKSEETGYQNASTYIEDTEEGEGNPQAITCNSVMDYYKNATTSDEVENDPATGPGSEQFATVRIAKWTAGYDEAGNPIDQKDYTPLGNAKFDLYVVDRDGNRIALLDTLTTGLDNDLSDAGEDEELSAWASSRAYVFSNLWNLYSKYNDGDEDIIWFDGGEEMPDGSGNGYVRVALVETSAPAGYAITNNVYYMLMCFEAVKSGNSSSETYNDAYYVTSDPGSAEVAAGTSSGQKIEWPVYVNHEDGTPVEGLDNTTEKQMLVNWPVNNYAVTVNKYGYEPNEYTLNKAAEGEHGLDEFFTTGSAGGVRTPLAGVTMRLQRNNGTASEPSWTDYNYTDMHAAATEAEAEFVTGENGSFSFPKGLIRGQYRIIEVQAADGYENIYNSGTRARYFTVTDDNVTVNMYNPKKLSMTIKKTDMDKDPIDNFNFTLINVDDNTRIQANTGTDGAGTAVLTDIASGTYRLTESGAGYTSVYLAQYMEETYPQLTNLVGTAGIELGYKTAVSDDGKDVVITDIRNLDDYGVTGDLTLTIQNPETGSLTVRKVNEENKNEMLDARFKIERQYFDTLDGTYTVGEEWDTVYENYATGEDGVFALNDLSPGVYRITETKAPEGFEMIDGETSQIIAISGDMDITSVVTEDGQSVQIYTGNGDAVLTFENRKLVGITVNKLLSGLAPDSDETYSFDFTLYDNPDAGSDDIVGRASASTEGGTQISPAQFTGLSKGKTYYLEETGGNTTDFALTGAALSQDDRSGAAVTETTDTEGTRVLYAVTIPAGISDDTNVAVDVTNKYLYAEVTIFKADGDDGTGLDGAEFEVYRVTGGDEEKLATTVQTGEKNPELEWITPEGRKAGEYTARIRLNGTDGETFRFRETAAPQDYILADDDMYIDVTLAPGDQKTYGTFSTEKSDEDLLKDLIMPNEKGAYIELSKYDNVHGSSSAKLLNGATFTIYTRPDEESAWSRLDSATTGENGTDGTIRFVVNGRSLYAIAETGLPENGRYEGLESVYLTAENGEDAAEVTETEKLDDNTMLYILNSESALMPGTTYHYNAYNTPYTELEIRKEDAGESASVPKAVVSVYELTDEQTAELPESQKLTGTQIAELEESAKVLVSDITTRKDGNGFSYADSSVADELGQVVAGRTYLVVETAVAETEGYNSTLIKDDNRVVWYAVKTIPEGGATGENAVVLKNISGSVTQSLKKTADVTGIQDSLFEQGSVLTYTLSPVVNNTYALAGYTLEDTGLKAYNREGEELPDYLTDGYSITSVAVGQASHNVSMYDLAAENAAAANVIYGEVTFKNFEGEVISTQTVIASDGQHTVVLPAGSGKAGSVSVRYYSEGFQAETDNRYSLGQEFTPGNVTITAEIDQQAGETGRQEIRKITNEASAAVSYRGWSSTGVQDKEPHTETVRASASNQFGVQDTAIVSVEKEADKTSVNVGDTFTYTITITNHADAGADLVDPIVIDFLPQGVGLAGTDTDVRLTDAGGPDSELTLDPAHAYRSESRGDDTAVLIFLIGTLAPGESASLTIDVVAGPSVVSHGTTLRNNVYVTSDQAGVESEENPGRASFKNSEGDWAETLDTVAADLGSRLATLKDLLGNIGGYGFVADSNEITWNSGSTLTLVKSASGNPEEDGFTTGQVTTVNNGTVTYRLTLSNSNSREGSTNFSVVDILPADGDYVGSGTVRNSQWPLHFGEIGSVRTVSADGSESPVDSSHYTVWYYNGEINGQSEYNAVYAAAQAEGMPAGWSEERSEDTKAFMLRTDNTVYLGENQSLVIEYTAEVGEYEDIEEVAYLNAMNSFSSQYDYYFLNSETPEEAHTSQYMAHSNSVPVIVTPDPVKVGGTIWIDKNRNGIWETGENVRDLSGYSIIQNMMDEVEIRLLEYTGTSQSSTSSRTYNKSEDTDWDENPNFVFDELNPARLLDTVTDIYGTDADDPYAPYPGGILDPSKLKGEQPYTYQIAVTLPGTIEGRFNITSVGETSGFSRNPASDYLADGAAERTDNNYRSTVTASGTAGVSERFYLWPTSVDTAWDNSKDIGLVPVRDLELTKTAKDDPANTPVSGAEFTIYGPYENGDTADISKAAEEGKVVGIYRTNEEGKIHVKDLLWFYDYVIVETAPADGYELDGAAAAGTNITARSDGNGWVLHTPEKDSTVTTEEVTVTNKREAAIELSASKVLTGRDLKQGEFTFDLLDSDGTTVLATAANDAAGNITFDITAEGAGIHTYYIREQSETSDNGVDYDDTNYRVTVQVDWNSTENKLVQGETIYYIGDAVQEDGAVFENTYTAEGSWTPEGIKKLTGRKMTEDDVFTFSVKENGSEVLTGTATGTADAEQADIVFDGSVSYGLADMEGKSQKIFTYTIEETGTQSDGLTFDTEPVTVTVTVTDDGKGNLIPDAVYTKDGEKITQAEFENTYTAQETEYTPSVEKIFTGIIPDDKTFTFELTADAENPGGAVLPGGGTKAEAQVTYEKGTYGDTARTASFGAIRFTEDGTYRFVITEQGGTEGDGFTYDDTKWTLTVGVKDNGKGKLVIGSTDITYSTDEDANHTGAVFENSYIPSPVPYQLHVSKCVEGAEMPSETTFEFTQSLEAGDTSGVDLPQNNTTSVTITQTGENGEQSGTFESMTFTKAGRYTFVIRETAGSKPGYSYDGSVWYADVTVADKQGSLQVTDATYRKGEDTTGNPTAAQFVNRYDTESIDYTPHVLKKLTGDPISDSKIFTFELTADRDNPQNGASFGGTDTATVSVTAQPAGGDSSDQQLQAGFDPITFTEAGRYTFYIREIGSETEDGYTYDTAQWTLTVEVQDAGGALRVISSEYAADGRETNDADAVFENSYTLTPTDYTPSVRKELAGDETPADHQQTFTFTMEAAADNPDGAVLGTGAQTDTAVITGAGTPAEGRGFQAIHFTREGQFRFLIRENEKPETVGGYTYDAGYWTLTVTVDDQNGRLTVTDHTYSYTPADGGENRDDSRTEAEFINNYAVTETTFVPQIRKTLDGDETPADNQKRFTFELTADKNNPDGAVLGKDTAVITGAGVPAEGDGFGAITFTRADTYRFEIRETGTAPDGYTFDDGVWTLTVTVTDENGALRVTGQTYTYTPDTGTDRNESTTEAEFINVYEVTDTSYTPQAAKKLTGDETPADQQKTFRFTVEAAADNPEGAVLGDAEDISAAVTGTGTTADPGADSFGAITFTKAGVFDFIIRETDGGEPGYTYDAGYWTLTVTVEDQESRLAVTGKEYVYSGEGAGHETNDTQALFVNNYQVKATEYMPIVEKVIDGEYPADQAKDFVFRLKAETGNPENGAVIQSDSVTITVEGEKEFAEPVIFTKAGVYTFLISEEGGDENGYTYDDTQWRLTVTVADVNSQLVVQDYTYQKDGAAVPSEEESDIAVFTNGYEVQPTEAVLGVVKQVSGDVPKDRDATFTFGLSRKEGSPEGAELPQNTEITITGSGENEFDAIKFNRADTYQFEIREINDGVPGYSYDGTVWTVTVKVIDVDSRLEVENITYDKDQTGTQTDEIQAAVFENSYSTTEVSYSPLVEKQITGDERPSERLFRFELNASEENPEGAVLKNQAEDAVSGPIYTETEGAGHAGFEPIRFMKAGTYRFAIREVNDGANGYTYDEGIWNLVVTVEDIDSVLTITDVVYTRDDGTENAEMAVFTNVYDSGSVTFMPEINKKVEGKVPEGTDQKFEFNMEAADDYGDSIVMPENTGTTVNGAGKAAFEKITFQKAGSYEFRLTENKGNTEGFTYDDSVWILTVDAADEDGRLVIRNAVYRKSGSTRKNADMAEFVNIYSSTPFEKIETVQTGDTTNGTMPVVLLFGSAAAAGWAVVRRRRKRKA